MGLLVLVGGACLAGGVSRIFPGVWFERELSPAPPPLRIAGVSFSGLQRAEPPWPEARRIRHVDSDAAPGGDGTGSAPWNDLQAALRALHPGDRLKLHPGRYRTRIRVDDRCRNGTPQAPIEIVGGPGVRIEAPPDPGSGLIVLTRSHWHLRHLEVAMGGVAKPALRLVGPGAHHLRIDSCHFHGGGSSGISMGVGSHHLRITRCTIHDFIHPTPPIDAHGISIRAGSSDILVADCHIYRNSGDSIQVTGPEQCGGGPASLRPEPARRITISGNRMHDDRENAIDIKTSSDIRIEGNLMWGYRPSRTSNGVAVTIHYGSRRITVTGNHIARSTTGIAVHRGSMKKRPHPLHPAEIEVSDNVIEGTAGSLPWAIRLGEIDAPLRVTGNRVIGHSRAVLLSRSLLQQTLSNPDFRLKNNRLLPDRAALDDH